MIKNFKKIKLALMFWLARRLPDCKTITPTISESLDRHLSVREKIIMKLHLWTCSKCTRYLEQIKFLSTAARHQEERFQEEENTLTRLHADAKERMRNALKSTTISAI